MLIKTTNSTKDHTELEAFVRTHPFANFFQSAKAVEFFRLVPNHTPILITAWENDKIIGSLVAVLIKEGNGLRGYFSRRLIVWGGPLVRDGRPEIYERILAKVLITALN